jgi:lipid-binding SYLF domain-containing protein
MVTFMGSSSILLIYGASFGVSVGIETTAVAIVMDVTRDVCDWRELGAKLRDALRVSTGGRRGSFEVCL